MAWRRLGWVSVLALLLIGVLCWWTGQAPVALLGASYVALLGLLSRVLPLRVAVSAAFVAQQALLLSLELLVPVVLGGPLRPGVALAVLVVPSLAVVPDLLLGDDEDPGPRQMRVPWQLVPAFLGAVVLVAVVRDQVAWTASGDARNHYLFARLVLREGGLHGDALSFQPLHQEALTALLLDTHGRGTLGPGALLEHDLHGLALTSLTLAVAWTLAGTAALLGLGPLRGRATWAVVAAASVLPLTGMGLGVLLRDGFLSILLLAPLLLCTLSVLAWLTTTGLTTTERSVNGVTVAVGITAAAIPLAAFTWTPSAIVVGAAALVPWWRMVRHREHRRRRVALLVAGIGTGATYYLYVVTEAAGRLVDAPGSIAPPSPVLIAVVVGLVLVIAWAPLTTAPAAAFVPYLVGSAVAVVVTLVAVLLQPEGQAWGYFPAKFAWAWLLAGLPLLLAPCSHPLTGRWWPPLHGAYAVALGIAIFAPVSSPVWKVDEWAKPSAGSLDLAVQLGDRSERFVVYRVDSPGEDRLANFWLVPYDAYDDPGLDRPTRDDPFFVWAYQEHGTASDICALLEGQPTRIVATSDPRAEEALETECGHGVRVRAVTPPPAP